MKRLQDTETLSVANDTALSKLWRLKFYGKTNFISDKVINIAL